MEIRRIGGYLSESCLLPFFVNAFMTANFQSKGIIFVFIDALNSVVTTTVVYDVRHLKIKRWISSKPGVFW